MFRPGRDEQRHSFGERRRRVLHLENTASLEHDVDLVLLVGLLPIGFRSDKDVHADLESR